MKMQSIRWANILCKKGLKPYLVIVTDGVLTHEIPVHNTRLDVVKRTLKEIYNVPSRRVLVSEILDD